eukprot:TRINITY_DN4235_c0_g2_i1.p1 TRINITY_DN4235_c0_g2~~TRINITY_DN4235_c0_g2_i1.p1  ORF type:complete len:445 (-),score=83.79 TRINITY_DN4235_c0_g2_i1:18-1283(-)
MVDNGRAPLRRGRLRLDLPLDEALKDLCSLLASEVNVPASSAPQFSQTRQLTKQISQSKLLSEKGAMIVKSSMQRSESLPGEWSREDTVSTRKSLRKREKNHASQLLEAYTRRGRDGQGAFHDKVKGRYSTFQNSSEASRQVPGDAANSQEALTLKDGVQIPLDRTASKHSEHGGDPKARSPVGQADTFFDSDAEVVSAPKEEKFEKVSEAVLARKLNMPFDVLRDACDTFRKYSDYRPGMDIGQARLDMHNFVKVVCDLCNVPNADALHPDFVDETFRTADRDCSGFIDVEEFCVWHASASFAEEMVLSEKDQQIRNISRTVGIPLVDVERFWSAFRRFDTDGSGEIDSEEFTMLLHILMKVPTGHVLPNERVQALWRQADSDSSGEINFEEFVMFYIQRFGYDPNRSEFDFSSFYKVGR